MIELWTTADVLSRVKFDDYSAKVLSDILLQTFIIDTVFEKSDINKVIILDKTEAYDFPNCEPEIDEYIENYHKLLYILSDTGEGIIIYQNCDYRPVLRSLQRFTDFNQSTKLAFAYNIIDKNAISVLIDFTGKYKNIFQENSSKIIKYIIGDILAKHVSNPLTLPEKVASNLKKYYRR